MERTQCAPWGLNGGGAGLPTACTSRTLTAPSFSRRTASCDSNVATPGDVLVIGSGGGGGYGDPKQRPRDVVTDDVRRGYMTREAALRDYGLSSEELDRLLEEPTT